MLATRWPNLTVLHAANNEAEFPLTDAIPQRYITQKKSPHSDIQGDYSMRRRVYTEKFTIEETGEGVKCTRMRTTHFWHILRSKMDMCTDMAGELPPCPTYRVGSSGQQGR